MPRVVDYFVVCGLQESGQLEVDTTAVSPASLPPLRRSFTAQVLYHYPKNVSWNPFDALAVKTLCMPEAVKLQTHSDMSTTFHPFLITRENGSRTYGAALTFYEPVTCPSIISSLESLQEKYLARHHKGLQDHSNLFTSSEDTLYATKCICLISSLPIARPLQCYLNQLYAITMGNETCDLPMESYLYNLLYEVSCPSPGQSVKFSGPLGSVCFRLPDLSVDLPLCDYSFRTFFELVSLHNVVQLFTGLLLEQQILLISSDLSRLMLCAQCFTSLLFPFSWPHVYVPILPSSQHGFLDAPVPFIMGLWVESNSKRPAILDEVSLCSLDIDRNVLDMVEDLPALPDSERLKIAIADTLISHSVSCPDISDYQRDSPSAAEENKLDSSTQILSYTSPQATFQKFIVRITSNDCRSASVSPTPGSPHETTSRWNYQLETRESDFTDAIRSIFVDFFLRHFSSYESFVIMPRQSYEQWTSNREQFNNFDKASFLSDKLLHDRPFFSAFSETTMFTTLIDNKIVSFWEQHNRTDANLVLFDKMIVRHRTANGLAITPTTPTSMLGVEAQDYDDVGVVESAPQPHPLNRHKEATCNMSTVVFERHTGQFPTLDQTILPEPEHLENMSNSMSEDPASRPRRDSTTGGSGRVPNQQQFSYHSHAKFVTQLLKESRLRVKHMVGSSNEGQNNIEENTHIAYLCDLLERIWGHGLKKRESKSQLWAHLMAYGHQLCHEDKSPPPPPLPVMRSPQITHRSPPPANTLNESPLRSTRSLTTSMVTLTSVGLRKASIDDTPNGSPDTKSPHTRRGLPFTRQKLQSPELRARIESILRPPSSSFLSDLNVVNNMREIKTEVGFARAWVRLALEKKSLSRHLSQLLINSDLCRQRYRPYAFLLTEEQQMQFLMHLLTLSASEFTCFTTGFPTTTMSYRILVVAEGKHFGLSTATLYFNISGEYRVSGVRTIPQGEYQTEFTCPNLGPLTCLRLGHDNSGMVPSLLVETVFVHCVTTGQTYRFKCGRWFARAEDDGSIERFLIGERIPRELKGSRNISALDVDSVVPSPGSKQRKSPKRERDRLMLSHIKANLLSAINNLTTTVVSKNRDTINHDLLPVLYGPEGFVSALEMAFLLGFKSSRKFQKRLFVWDLVERTLEALTSSSTGSPRPAETEIGGGADCTSDPPTQQFINAASRINRLPSIGKDEKIMLFFLLGLRDHHLHGWVKLLSHAPPTQTMYEATSFLRDPELFQFLLDALAGTSSLTVFIEPLLLQGL